MMDLECYEVGMTDEWDYRISRGEGQWTLVMLRARENVALSYRQIGDNIQTSASQSEHSPGSRVGIAANCRSCKVLISLNRTE